MRVSFANCAERLSGLLARLACVTVLALSANLASAAEQSSQEPLALTLSFDRPLDSSAAPFIVAASRGAFGAEGINVATNTAAGSPEAIARVASGVSEFGLVDINALMRFRDGPGAAPVKAVFMLFNRAPYAIMARKSRGIRDLADMEGKTLGVADGDLSIAFWPAIAKRNALKAASVKQERIGASVREPMLSAGQVDAVSGFSYLSGVNLRDRGIPGDDLAVLRYADYGCEAYGMALVVNPKFAIDRPAVVKAFLRAVVAGLHATIRDPDRAADDVVARMPGGSRDLERDRLHTAIRDNYLSDEVRRDGFGGIDVDRFNRSVDQLAEGFRFARRPAASDIFDGAFLPAAATRASN